MVTIRAKGKGEIKLSLEEFEQYRRRLELEAGALAAKAGIGVSEVQIVSGDGAEGYFIDDQICLRIGAGIAFLRSERERKMVFAHEIAHHSTYERWSRLRRWIRGGLIPVALLVLLLNFLLIPVLTSVQELVLLIGPLSVIICGCLWEYHIGRHNEYQADLDAVRLTKDREGYEQMLHGLDADLSAAGRKTYSLGLIKAVILISKPWDHPRVHLLEHHPSTRRRIRYIRKHY